MRLSRVRVGFQVFLHVVLIGHVLAYYWMDWRAVGALDFPSFFHHFLGKGLLTAGALLAIVVYGTALVFGRLFCSWGCHFGATQDFAAWVLRRFGWRSPFLRTRFLHWLPFLFLAVIFGVPLFARRLREDWEFSVDMAEVAPWDALPGWAMSIATFLVCGAGLLFFLGTRGFCRFVCPYGALFRVTDRLSPFRVRRVAQCSGSGSGSGGGSCVSSLSSGEPDSGTAVPPCTAACPTAIDVHRETARAGAVTSFDCVRCNLCIEECPNGALAYRARPTRSSSITSSAAGPLDASFGSTSGRASTGLPGPAVPPPAYTLSLGAEALVAIVTLGTYLTIDLVYGGHFVAASLALAEGFLAYAALFAFGRRAGRGRWSFAGVTAVGALLLSLVPLFEAGAFKTLRYKALQIDPPREESELDLARGQPGDAEDTDVGSALNEAAGLYQRALAYFPRHEETLRLLLSVYLRLNDRRAVPVAEEIWHLDHNSRSSGELLYWVYLRYGDLERARLLDSSLDRP